MPYATRDVDFFRRELNVPPGFAPDIAIIHGEADIPSGMSIAETMVEGVSRPLWNLAIGRFHNLDVAFAGVAGAAMAGEMAHALSRLGAGLLVQTGYYGGLTRDQTLGDVLVVTEAFAGEGTAQYYSKTNLIKANREIVQRLVAGCRGVGLTTHSGSVFTTGAMFAETPADVRRWERGGFLGVDGETVATLAVAKRFNVPCGAALVHSDHVIVGRTVQDASFEATQKIDSVISKLIDIVFHAAQ